MSQAPFSTLIAVYKIVMETAYRIEWSSPFSNIHIADHAIEKSET